MDIVYETGDLLATPYPLIVHGCNAQGVMGSGVAKLIREKFPCAYEAYKTKFIAEGLKLGEVIFVPISNKIIANAITQEFYGRDGKCYVSYESINTAMELVNSYASKHEIAHVALPLIGAGYGGGSWKIISNIIQEKLTDTTPVVYTLDGVIPSN